MQGIYNRNEITRQLPKKVMKELLLWCTKDTHFAYNNGVYQQNDGVVMGPPLGPVLGGIFMVITTAQLHSTKPELRICAGSNPIHGVLEIRDGEDL